MLHPKVLSLFIAINCIAKCTEATKIPPKIAVVGAGIGGTSVSYFLREIFGEGNVEVDIFEANEVGGRLQTISMGDQSYEVGGSIIHPDNVYMAHFAKKFGLPKIGGGSASSKFAFYDGKGIVFMGSDWETIAYVKMLWRYGWGPIKLNNYVEKVLHDFKRIYALQGKGRSFLSVEDLLKIMNPGFAEDFHISSENGFAELGINNLTIQEVIMAGLIVNYGQTISAHKFVGSVSCATGNGHLWAISGGNKQVPEMLLKSSGANFIKAKVKEVSFIKESGKYNLSYSLDTSKEELEIDTVVDEYDIVIIAAPLTTSDTSDIAFENFPSPLNISEGKYHRLVCTIVKGEVNYSYFGLDYKVNEIFSVRGGLKINSLSRVHGVWPHSKSDDGKVWKIFSQDQLTREDLNEMFIKVKDAKEVDWFAYPHYDSDQKLGSFVLHRNLFHINAIEWAASAMEMSVIAAKNVALLAQKSWTSTDHFHRIKDEL